MIEMDATKNIIEKLARIKKEKNMLPYSSVVWWMCPYACGSVGGTVCRFAIAGMNESA